MIDEAALEQQILDFARQLKGVIYHPRKRLHILKTYVDALTHIPEDGIAEFSTKHASLQHNVQLFPNPSQLTPYIGENHRNHAAISALITQFNAQFTHNWLQDPLAKEYCNKASLFLQVEVVKTTQELEAMDDTDTAIIRQDQEMDVTEDSDTDNRDEEKIEQDQDIPLDEDALEAEVQNLAFILSQHTTSPINEQKETDSSFADKMQSKKESVEKETAEETTKNTIKQVSSAIQGNLTKGVKPVSSSFSDKVPSPGNNADNNAGKKSPDGRSL